jgi:SAM-dependent methyltransferase
VSFRGQVDICVQSHVAGWAADSSGNPARVTIQLNGLVVTTATETVHRPDLLAHGVSERCGFTFVFEQPLDATDRIEVLLPDGSQLTGSPCTSHQARLRELLGAIEPEMRGLEIGPLDRPILSKVKYRVSYVDHASREDLIAKYKSSATAETLSPERIVPVDIVWTPGKTLADCVLPGAKYDYCLASHVIEHVADPIGWLQQIASVLNDGGVVTLAVPDKERTFVSRPADLIDACVRQITRPSPLHVFDHITSVSQIGVELPPPSPAQIREAFAHAMAAHHSGRHVDVHCHVFTQDSFLEVFETIAHIGILPLKLRRFYPTRTGANEFIVSLQMCSAKPAEIAESYRRRTGILGRLTAQIMALNLFAR